MITQLENLTIDQGNHESNCGNCSDDADCSCNLLSKPKNSGCTQEGDCSCKPDIFNEVEAVKNKKSPKADCMCFGEDETWNCSCGHGSGKKAKADWLEIRRLWR